MCKICIYLVFYQQVVSAEISSHWLYDPCLTTTNVWSCVSPHMKANKLVLRWVLLVHIYGCRTVCNALPQIHLIHKSYIRHIHTNHHGIAHHHVHEGLCMFPVPWSSKWSWSLHIFFGHPMFLRPFGLYCSACFGILFVFILYTCCGHFFWYCFISFTMFCAPIFFFS